jgi:hypothetical protein
LSERYFHEFLVAAARHSFDERGVGASRRTLSHLSRRAREVSAAGAGRNFTAMYTKWYSVYMTVRHKHLKIDQRKLDRAKRILRLATERETIDRALDAVLTEDDILRAHRKVMGVGGFIDVHGRDE